MHHNSTLLVGSVGGNLAASQRWMAIRSYVYPVCTSTTGSRNSSCVITHFRCSGGSSRGPAIVFFTAAMNVPTNANCDNPIPAFAMARARVGRRTPRPATTKGSTRRAFRSTRGASRTDRRASVCASARRPVGSTSDARTATRGERWRRRVTARRVISVRPTTTTTMTTPTTTTTAASDERAAFLTPGPRPTTPSDVGAIRVPTGYATRASADADDDDDDAGLVIEIGDPHRVGDGLSKHIEYKVTYWTDSATYGGKDSSGCSTRRFSDFEWLSKQLGANCDGVIIPLLPSKTILHMDDPSSRGIERRRKGLAAFMARCAAHPLVRKSADLHAFLTQDSKSWTQRVPWYERGVLSEGVSSVTSWLSTLNTSDMKSLTSSMSVDVMREKQQHVDVVEYVTKLKLRLEKLIAATSALQKHGAHTVSAYEEFNACLELLAGQEEKARSVFAQSGAKGVWWQRLSDLFTALIPPQRQASELMSSEFLDSLNEVHALCTAVVAAFDARKRVVDHYNKVSSSIERIESKLSTMGVPEPGPKREEKQKIELAVSDLRIERTQTHERYERCCANMEHELLWFHTELALVLGQALKKHVAAQGAAAGNLSRVQDSHFMDIKAMMANKPQAFVG